MHKAFATGFCAILLALCVTAPAAAASRQTYTYQVEHPKYGNIGTYADTVELNGDLRRIDTKLRIAVKLLGIVVFREEADRTETWRGNRLISFHSVTVTNGDKLEVTGEAKDDSFVVTTPSGTAVGPVDIYPSSPWAAAMPKPVVMMSTKSGKLFAVKAANGGEPDVISLYGSEVQVRHYDFQTDKHQDVWMNPRGIPVRFRTEEDGIPVDFTLNPEQLAALAAQ